MLPALPNKEFYFVRDGETDVNSNLHINDLPLNERGIDPYIYLVIL